MHKVSSGVNDVETDVFTEHKVIPQQVFVLRYGHRTSLIVFAHLC